MKKRRWLLPDWAYVPIAIFNIVMIFYMIIVGCVLIYVGRKQVSDYPDSVWYCEETNMRATVIAPEDDVDYIAIVDLDDGEKYTVDMPWPIKPGLYRGDIHDTTSAEKAEFCECGFEMEERRFVQKIRSFTLNTADNCPHLPCDGSITFVREK
ncbi:MAG: hypothetical protein II982_01085 [Clostridia bacterium]|nr:hypothetical protein [Clostridia bacterium]